MPLHREGGVLGAAAGGLGLAETLRELDQAGRSLQDALKRRLGEEEKQGALSFRLAMQVRWGRVGVR